MDWQVLLDGNAEKYLERLPERDEKKIREVIRGLGVNPFIGDIQKMRGEQDVWRRRVGSYRVFYEVRLSEKMIYIFDIQRRTSRTY